MTPGELVTIYTVTSPGRAEIIKGALEGEGIRCELGGARQGGYSGLFEIDVMVWAEDADRAREAIEAHERMP